MSALAHMMERLGIATVVIGLIRAHMEKTRPPRGLWVPFPLGRPLGEADDKSFQRKVLGIALGLLERADGPVLLDDFPVDAPSMTDADGWRPAISLRLRAGLPSSPHEWMDALDSEMDIVHPYWEAACRRFGKTTVGNSRMPKQAWSSYAAPFLSDDVPAQSPVPGLSPAVVLRYVADDLKAFYSEAIQAEGDAPSNRQVESWFWNHTVAADFLRALRNAALSSRHHGFNTGSRFYVPAPWIEKGA